MQTVLTALAAAIAVGVEMVEAMAIVLAVGTSRRWRDALLGAGAACVACVALAAIVGPALLARVPLGAIQVIVGGALLLFGLEWLRKGTLRLAGRRARSSAVAEYDEVREELEAEAPVSSGADWPARAAAFKGVFLEGVEVILIVSALAADPSRRVAALAGAAVALVVVVGTGAWLRHPLARLPETELKYGVGIVLTSFGVFFSAEGLDAHWPGDDAALLYIAAALVIVTQAQIAAMTRRHRRRATPA